MDKKYNEALIENAKELRKNMTKEERHLWFDYLKNAPLKFVRRKVIGKYIADFYCASAGLIIELDGSQHYDEQGLEYDRKRTDYLEGYGIKVVRIANNEVNGNFTGVCEYIESMLKEKSE